MWMNRCHWRSFTGAIALSCLAIPACADPPERALPNVVFLVADDMRADCIGAFGNRVIKTPNLDALAASGFAMRNAYCLGSDHQAVCTPSRNMILSGQTYFRGWKNHLAPASGPNLPNTMKSAGYTTYRYGKQYNVAYYINECFDENHSLADEHAERLSGHPGRTITDAAIKFLDRRPKTKPFFMYLEYEAPHDPRVATRQFRDLYQPDSIPLPANFLPLHPWDNGAILVRDEQLEDFPREPDKIKRHLHDYYAVISSLDAQVGRLVEALKARRLDDNTLIIFVGDSGLAVGSHGLMGKQNLYEHSMRAPMILAGPGIKHGESDALVYLLDCFPTICELVGIKPPADIDGLSFAEVVRGRAKTARPTLFTAYTDVQRAIRDDRWKLIRYPHVDQTQLFDLRADPDETNNLANDPAQRARVADLTRQLAAWQKRLGDTTPLELPGANAAQRSTRRVPNR